MSLPKPIMENLVSADIDTQSEQILLTMRMGTVKTTLHLKLDMRPAEVVHAMRSLANTLELNALILSFRSRAPTPASVAELTVLGN